MSDDEADGNSPGHDPKVVHLSQRDLEDAARLLTLISRAQHWDLVMRRPPAGNSRGKPADRNLVLKAREILLNRQRRARFFGSGMFGEPAWDMLLLLYVLDAGSRQTIGHLIQLSGHQKTTGLRWLEYLERERLVRRVPHPTDKRTDFIALTSEAKSNLELFLSETSELHA